MFVLRSLCLTLRDKESKDTAIEYGYVLSANGTTVKKDKKDRVIFTCYRGVANVLLEKAIPSLMETSFRDVLHAHLPFTSTFYMQNSEHVLFLMFKYKFLVICAYKLRLLSVMQCILLAFCRTDYVVS